MANKLGNYIADFSRTYDRFYRRGNTPKNKKLTHNLALLLAVLLLFATTVYASFQASNNYSTDSNVFITTQQYSKDLKFPVTMPGPHAILEKLPIVYIQGHLPYHYTSYTVLNVGVVLVTMFAWAFLLIKLFGRRYEVPILILLSSLIMTSVIFSLSILYIAIRNIEYPIALWFVMIVGSLLKSRVYTRRQVIGGILGSLIFCVTLAGDSFFNYAVLVPLLAAIIWYWVQSREFTANMLKALGLIVGVVAGAALLKFILSAAGIINFNYAFWGQNTIIPTRSLAPSLSIAFRQVMDLHGANIFGQPAKLGNMSVFINFGLMLLAVISLVIILLRAGRNFKNRIGFNDQHDFVFVTMAISFFVAFLIYVLSGYVISTLPNGQIISVENTRYISILPFISTIAIIWFLKSYYDEYRGLISIACLVLVISIFASYSGVKAAYKSGIQLELAPSRASIDQIQYILKSNDTHEVIADYWYGPVLQFWSDNTIKVNQSACSLPLKITAQKEGKFTRRPGIKSAVIIDRGGLNYAYWSCSDAQIEKVYGTPNKRLEVPGVTSNPVKIWLYDAR